MDLTSSIDHTLLKPDARETDIENLCLEAKTHQFYSVCLNGFWISRAKTLLKGSSVKICSVVGFPLGNSVSSAKADETRYLLAEGADEIDMVMNIGALKSGLTDECFDDMKAVVKAANGNLVKVIIETCLLTKEEKIRAAELVVASGAQFVKTSTGFSLGGATLEDIRLLREIVGKDFGVKASGGIKNRESALQMIEAGANRLGTSQSVAIVLGKQGAGNY